MHVVNKIGLMLCFGAQTAYAQTYSITDTYEKFMAGQYVSISSNNVYGSVELTSPSALDDDCDDNIFAEKSLVIGDTNQYEEFNALVATLLSASVNGEQVTFEYTPVNIYYVGYICTITSVQLSGI